MGMGIKLGLGLTPSEGGSDLYRLFANGEDGFLFGNFGDLTRLFTTSQGPTQVAVDADPVGLALEDSKWSKQSLSQVVAAQPNVAPAFVVGGTGYSVTNSDATHIATFGAGTLRYQSDTTSPQMNVGPSSVVWTSGKTYKITTVCTSWTSGSIKEAGSNAVLATGVGTTVVYVVAAGNGPTITRNSTNVDLTISSITAQLVTGNHAIQATGVQRPVYKPNSGKPYLLTDGSDDCLVTPFKPTVAVTVALAARFTSAAATAFLVGGGAIGTGKRCRIGIDTSGNLSYGFGASYATTTGILNADRVFVLTGDASTREIWMDGAQVDSGATTSVFDGTGGGLTLGSNNDGGTPGLFAAGRIYGALAINRRVTASEIALITSKFRSTYQ